MAFIMVLPQRWLLHRMQCSGHNLRLLPHGFPDAVPPEDHERLIEEFFSAANSIAFNTLADDVVSKLFSGP